MNDGRGRLATESDDAQLGFFGETLCGLLSSGRPQLRNTRLPEKRFEDAQLESCSENRQLYKIEGTTAESRPGGAIV